MKSSDISSVTISAADGKSESVIALTWSFNNPGAADHAEFERTNPDSTVTLFDAFSSPHEDTGLAPVTSYSYRAHGVDSIGNTSGWSGTVSAKTLGFIVLGPITQDGPFGSVDNKTVKCEIAAADIVAPSFVPAQIWITLGQPASATETITFSKVFIGQQAPGGDPWDAVSLTPVLFGSGESTIVAPGDTSRSDDTAFTWDGTSALVLSMYFSGGDLSDQLSARTTGASNTHLKDAVDEAATADATGYQSFPGYLSGVVEIEVA